MKKMKKGDFHCHSLGSDGLHSLDYILEMYSAEGFNVVAITDHYTIASS